MKALVESAAGVEKVLLKKDTEVLNHPRCGDLVAVADADSWFTYYYWNDDRKAPDFARTVDIHRKPGYDPAEMFIDPKIKWTVPKVLWKLFLKKLGFRTLMNVIPLDASLVKGSHGRRPDDKADFPIFISAAPVSPGRRMIKSTDVYNILYNQITNNK